MAKITHPEMSGGKNVSMPNTKAENYIVDDATDTKSSIDDRLSEFEQAPVKKAPEQNIDLESRKKLEKLIFIGKYNKTITLAGHKFEISTLAHSENNEIMSKLMNIGDAADLFTIRTLTLANALKSIDDTKLDSEEIGGSTLEERANIINDMQLALVEKLYDAYEKLVKEADEVVYGEKIKN